MDKTEWADVWTKSISDLHVTEKHTDCYCKVGSNTVLYCTCGVSLKCHTRVSVRALLVPNPSTVLVGKIAHWQQLSVREYGCRTIPNFKASNFEIKFDRQIAGCVGALEAPCLPVRPSWIQSCLDTRFWYLGYFTIATPYSSLNSGKIMAH